MSIDLHIHTTASDGDIDPVTVARMAARAGLRIIALADHESTSGCEPARLECQTLGLTLIPGVELLTVHRDKEVHLLGYFPDPAHPYLQEQLACLREERTVCARESVRMLSEHGYELAWPEVEKLAKPGSPVSKGHIMQALHGSGYIRERSDAIDFLNRFLNPEGLAYVCHPFPFTSGIDLIRDVGGIPVLAHPGLIRDDEIVRELCELGVDGVEVFYYYFGQHRAERVQRYNALAEEKGLLKTGGSDYHGTYTPVVLGENNVPTEEVRAFLERFGI